MQEGECCGCPIEDHFDFAEQKIWNDNVHEAYLKCINHRENVSHIHKISAKIKELFGRQIVWNCYRGDCIPCGGFVSNDATTLCQHGCHETAKKPVTQECTRETCPTLLKGHGVRCVYYTGR